MSLRSIVCLTLLSVHPCGSPLALWLRLPPSVPIGSFHPIRFCPCWAHPAPDENREIPDRIRQSLSCRTSLFSGGSPDSHRGLLRHFPSIQLPFSRFIARTPPWIPSPQHSWPISSPAQATNDSLALQIETLAQSFACVIPASVIRRTPCLA